MNYNNHYSNAIDNIVSQSFHLIMEKQSMNIFLCELFSLSYWVIIILVAPRLFPDNLEHNRKFVHIMIANWWFFAIHLFNSFIPAMLTPLIFIFVNAYATFGNSASFVGGLKRTTKDYSLGLIMYPLGYIVSLFFAYYICTSRAFAGIGIMALGYGDGFAAIIGKKFDYLPYYVNGSKKTLSGSLAMFLFTFISVFIYSYLYSLPSPFITSLVSASVGTIIEALASKGTDNLLIPLSVIVANICW